MNPLSSDFDPTVMIFGANDSGGLSLGYNGNSISVYSQTEFQTCHKMPKQNFQVLERGKDIRFHSVLIFLELVCLGSALPRRTFAFLAFFFLAEKFDLSLTFQPILSHMWVPCTVYGLTNFTFQQLFH